MGILDYFRGHKQDEINPAPKKKQQFKVKDNRLEAIAKFESNIQRTIHDDIHSGAMDSVAMDSNDLSFGDNSALPEVVLSWFGSHNFITHQACAILSQHWLIKKACYQLPKASVRRGYEISIKGTAEQDEIALKKIRETDAEFKLTYNLIDYLGKGRVFGLRVAVFLYNFHGEERREFYENPFNIDGVTKGKYAGFTCVDPYFCSPIIGDDAIRDPLSPNFYEPTWWLVYGQKIHRSHVMIFRHDEVPDILKPTYLYGGVPLPQQLFERVYASERIADEIPALLMSKRMTVIYEDIEAITADQAAFEEALQAWVRTRDNFGVKVVSKDGKIEMQDMSLTDLDKCAFIQWQTLAAIADTPITELLGTQVAGFNSAGDSEKESYYAKQEELQSNYLSPLLERHYQLLVKSHISPEKPFTVQINWNPADSPTALELAQIRLTNAQADQIYMAEGAVSQEEVRGKLGKAQDSGYTGISQDLPDVSFEQADPDNEFGFGMDDDRWITVNSSGVAGAGSPALIGENGEIKGGMGGKFTGQKISEISSGFVGPKSPATAKISAGKEVSEVKTTNKTISENKTTAQATEKQRELISKDNRLFLAYASPGEGARAKWREGIAEGKYDHLAEMAEKNKKADEENKKADETSIKAKKDAANAKWREKNLPRLAAAKAERERIERADRQQRIDRAKAYYEAKNSPNKTYLNVPYEQREIAKENGAYWDPDAKKWFVGGDIPQSLSKFKPSTTQSGPSSIQGLRESAPKRPALSLPTSGRINDDDPSIWGSALLGHEGSTWRSFRDTREGRAMIEQLSGSAGDSISSIEDIEHGWDDKKNYKE
jgi:phage-related protein (TIGR01555 family)